MLRHQRRQVLLTCVTVSVTLLLLTVVWKGTPETHGPAIHSQHHPGGMERRENKSHARKSLVDESGSVAELQQRSERAHLKGTGQVGTEYVSCSPLRNPGVDLTNIVLWANGMTFPCHSVRVCRHISPSMLVV